jgi:hypothetical protein
MTIMGWGSCLGDTFGAELSKIPRNRYIDNVNTEHMAEMEELGGPANSEHQWAGSQTEAKCLSALLSFFHIAERN